MLRKEQEKKDILYLSLGTEKNMVKTYKHKTIFGKTFFSEKKKLSMSDRRKFGKAHRSNKKKLKKRYGI